MIINTERDILQELQILSGLKIFPSTELFIIRKETKAFRDANGRLSSDVTIEDNTFKGLGPKGSLIHVSKVQLYGPYMRTDRIRAVFNPVHVLTGGDGRGREREPI